MVFKPKKPAIIIGVVVVLLIIGLIIFLRPRKDDSTVTIILSPHFDDATLSLGGLLAEHKHNTVVASFFTGAPTVATTTPWDKKSGFNSSKDAIDARVKENAAALKGLADVVTNYDYLDNQYRNGTSTDAQMEQDIAKDIQALLAAYSGKHIDIYAPSIFTPDITHPDHAMLHNAFVDVVKNYPTSNINFYFYEDFPYVLRFNKQSVISIQKNDEKDTGFLLEKTTIPLTSGDVKTKEKNIKDFSSQVEAFKAAGQDIIKDSTDYTNTRCGTSACEVVYKVFRI